MWSICCPGLSIWSVTNIESDASLGWRLGIFLGKLESQAIRPFDLVLEDCDVSLIEASVSDEGEERELRES